MADGKVDLPDDFLVSRALDEACILKGDASRGNGDYHTSQGFLDEPKDQQATEVIPLSPQWLYSRPESKAFLSAPSGDVRGPEPQKEAWKSDVSQDKKEWRRNTSEIESGRRWREEERETSALSRNRRKEGDRESEFRKTDRRVDNILIREVNEGRSLPPSDRWNDANVRNSVHEARRDSKWSSRWGPEERDKESRNEKRTEPDKEEPSNEKQTFSGNNREREADSRDKWRPRHHRLEVHSIGSMGHRAAPGFGLDKARSDGTSAVGFAPGRGRAQISGIGMSFSTPIGASQLEASESMYGKPGLSAKSYRYPRGKLLDIYRKQENFNILTNGFHEEVPQITETNPVQPLAFVAPDDDEESVLGAILKGEIVGSDVPHIPVKYGVGKSASEEGVQQTGIFEGKTLEGSILFKEDDFLCFSEGKVGSAPGRSILGELDSTAAILDKASSIVEGKQKHGGLGSTTDISLNDDVHFANPSKSNEQDYQSLNVQTRLPSDVNFNFDLLDHHEDPILVPEPIVKNADVNLASGTFNLEELSLFYRDPQGDIQGPFLGIDIISWFEQGFFGTDLPVCVADAPEGTPFQELGDIMPHLKAQMAPSVGYGNKLDMTDSVENGRLQFTVSHPENSASSFSELGGHHPQAELSNYEESMYRRLYEGNVEASPSILNADKQSDHIIVGQQIEESFQSRPVSGDGMQRSSTGVLINPLDGLPRQQFPSNEFGETSGLNPLFSASKRNILHAHEAPWAEVEGIDSQHFQTLSMSSNAVNPRYFANQEMGGDAVPFLRTYNPLGTVDDPTGIEQWSDSTRRDPIANASRKSGNQLDAHRLLQLDAGMGLHAVPESVDALRLRQMEANGLQAVQETAEAHRFLQLEQEARRMDRLYSQQLQKQRLQQQNNLSHSSMQFAGVDIDHGRNPSRRSHAHSLSDLEHHLVKLQQQQQLELQQQHLQQLQQQQMRSQQQQQQQQSHLLEQLLQRQLRDPGFGQHQVDLLRNNAAYDQMLSQPHGSLLAGIQPTLEHSMRIHDPTIPHLLQAKVNQGLHRAEHNNILQLLSQAKQEARLPTEEQQFLLGLHHDQLRAQQFSQQSRHHQQALEEERRIRGAWSTDEPVDFLRMMQRPEHALTAGLRPLDHFQLLQQQQQQHRVAQSPHLFDHSSQLERNLQRGIFDHNSLPFERVASAQQHAASVPNQDLMSTLAQLQGLDLQERHDHLQVLAKLHSLNPEIHHANTGPLPTSFQDVKKDPLDSRWPDQHLSFNNMVHSGQQTDAWMEAHLQQMHLEKERSVRNAEMNRISEEPMPNHLLMEPLRQKQLRPEYPPDIGDTTMFAATERPGPSWIFRDAQVAQSSMLLQEQESMGSSFVEGSSSDPMITMPENLTLGDLTQAEADVNTQINPLAESDNILSALEDTAVDFGTQQDLVVDDNNEIVEAKDEKKGKKRGLKIKPTGKLEAQLTNQRVADMDRGGELIIHTPVRHPSLGSSGGNAGLQLQELIVDDSVTDQRSTASATRGVDSLKLQPAPQSFSMTEARRELPSKGNSSSAKPPSLPDGQREVARSLPKAQLLETPTMNKRDAGSGFRRASSYSDVDTSQRSFIDMLKKPVTETDTAEASEAASQSARSNKKKGKKGRQIDPALLGFKVSSNRIMMGEIHRLED